MLCYVIFSINITEKGYCIKGLQLLVTLLRYFIKFFIKKILIIINLYIHINKRKINEISITT